MQGKNNQGLYTAGYQYSCTSQFAKSRIGSSLTTNACPAPTSYANGSALVYYNSTSYTDDMMWAAGWLFLATGTPQPAGCPQAWPCSVQACC